MKIKVTVVVLLALGGILAALLLFPERPQVLDTSDALEENQLSERLRIAAEGEAFIAVSIAENFPSLLGIRPEDLDQTHQDLLSSLASRQDAIRNEILDLTTDLREHVSISRDNQAEQVLRGIENSAVESEFAKIQENIEKNQLYEATDSAASWSKQLSQWSEQLTDPNHNKNKPNKAEMATPRKPSDQF